VEYKDYKGKSIFEPIWDSVLAWKNAYEINKKEIMIFGTRQTGKTSMSQKMFEDMIKEDISAGVSIPVKELFKEKEEGDYLDVITKYAKLQGEILEARQKQLSNSRVLYNNSESQIYWKEETEFNSENNDRCIPSNSNCHTIWQVGSSIFSYEQSNKYDKEYPHKCFDCKQQIHFAHAWGKAREQNISKKQFVNMWKSEVVEFYCCYCFNKIEKIEKKNTRLLAKAKRICDKFGYELR